MLRRTRARSDEGVSLIEVMVAMFMLAVIAVAFIPLITSALRASSSNNTNAAGVQLLNGQLERSRTQGSTCSAITTWATSTDATRTVVAPQNVTLKATIAAVCPTTYPGTARVTVSVAKTSGVVVGTGVTLVQVLTAS